MGSKGGLLKILVVGAGEVGYHIASHLAYEKKDVVVIDTDSSALGRVAENVDVQTIDGSGSSPEILEEAGIREAEIVLAVTNSDEVNLVACLVADILSPSTIKMARIRASAFDHYGEAFQNHAPHIDTVINPEIEVVRTIERMMRLPGAVDVGELAGGRVKFVGVNLESGSRLDGVRLQDLSGVIGTQAPLIAAVVREEKLTIPRGSDCLRAGDLVYFVCEKEKVLDSLKIFNKHVAPIRRAMIIGGGRIGFRLARALEDGPVYTRIVEKSADRCRMLAEHLNKAVILHGDGSDQDLLSQENIRDMDVVVTLTGDEETNILASLLVKRLGAKKTITQISKFSYFPLVSTIGLEQVVSPRLSAINSILQHIRKGKVLSAISLKGEQAEVIEAVALETSGIVGKPLQQISLPKGVLVTSIIRGETVIIPSGESVIEPDDRIIVFAGRQAIGKLEKILAVKLEYF
jgi:trk/ktr system potassium uptake protein